MLVGSNKARKSTNKNFLSIIKSFNNLLMILSLMAIMFAMGLCNDGDCAYIQRPIDDKGYFLLNETNNNYYDHPTQDYLLAVKLQTLSTWLVIIYVGTGIYLFIKKHPKLIERIKENERKGNL